MPIPKPRKRERRDPFIERCMGNASMNEDYPDNAQRYAICIDAFENKAYDVDDEEFIVVYTEEEKKALEESEESK